MHGEAAAVCKHPSDFIRSSCARSPPPIRPGFVFHRLRNSLPLQQPRKKKGGGGWKREKNGEPLAPLPPLREDKLLPVDMGNRLNFRVFISIKDRFFPRSRRQNSSSP